MQPLLTCDTPHASTPSHILREHLPALCEDLPEICPEAARPARAAVRLHARAWCNACTLTMPNVSTSCSIAGCTALQVICDVRTAHSEHICVQAAAHSSDGRCWSVHMSRNDSCGYVVCPHVQDLLPECRVLLCRRSFVRQLNRCHDAGVRNATNVMRPASSSDHKILCNTCLLVPAEQWPGPQTARRLRSTDCFSRGKTSTAEHTAEGASPIATLQWHSWQWVRVRVRVK